MTKSEREKQEKELYGNMELSDILKIIETKSKAIVEAQKKLRRILIEADGEAGKTLSENSENSERQDLWEQLKIT
jgi:hypothetical protein